MSRRAILTAIYGLIVGDNKFEMRETTKEISVKIKRSTNVDRMGCRYRRNVTAAVYGGFRDEAGSLLHIPIVYDKKHIYNHLSACFHRLGTETLPRDGGIMQEFREFYREFILQEFQPLGHEDLISTKEWTEKFDGRRCKYFKKILEDLAYIPANQASKCKGFIKAENYEKLNKLPRLINHNDDRYKVLFGPAIYACDKKLFGKKWFVKGTDPKDWPKKMAEFQGKVIETDHSAFEHTHTGEYAELKRFFYMHMLREVLTNHEKRILAQQISGDNFIDCGTCTIVVKQRLMSGALWTSSSNSLINFLTQAFMAAKARGLTGKAAVAWVREFFKGLFEGDDGLTLDYGITDTLIEAMGLRLELQRYDSVYDSKFCGQIIEPVHGDIVCDPMKIFQKFHMLDSKYQMARENKCKQLLRAKAMSYKYLYGNMPIVGILCDKVLETTRGIDVRSVMSETDGYHEGRLQRALDAQVWKMTSRPTEESRVLIERRFKYSISQQLEIERLIGESNGLTITMNEYLIGRSGSIEQLHPHHPIPRMPRELVERLEASVPWTKVHKRFCIKDEGISQIERGRVDSWSL